MLKTQDDESPRMEKQGPLQESGVRGRASKQAGGTSGFQLCGVLLPRTACGRPGLGRSRDKPGGWVAAGRLRGICESFQQRGPGAARGANPELRSSRGRRLHGPGRGSACSPG